MYPYAVSYLVVTLEYIWKARDGLEGMELVSRSNRQYGKLLLPRIPGKDRVEWQTSSSRKAHEAFFERGWSNPVST